MQNFAELYLTWVKILQNVLGDYFFWLTLYIYISLQLQTMPWLKIQHQKIWDNNQRVKMWEQRVEAQNHNRNIVRHG